MQNIKILHGEIWLEVCTGDHGSPEEVPQTAFMGKRVREGLLQ